MHDLVMYVLAMQYIVMYTMFCSQAGRQKLIDDAEKWKQKSESLQQKLVSL